MAEGRMTNARFMFLHRAAQNCGHKPAYPRGTAIMFEQQGGHIRQMRWAIANRMVKAVGGRLEITGKGRKAMESAR